MTFGRCIKPVPSVGTSARATPEIDVFYRSAGGADSQSAASRLVGTHRSSQVHEKSRLTRADILALAAAIYEPQPRIWTKRGWQCPQCKKLNHKKHKQCTCGITRDGLPEFCERASALTVA